MSIPPIKKLDAALVESMLEEFRVFVTENPPVSNFRLPLESYKDHLIPLFCHFFAEHSMIETAAILTKAVKLSFAGPAIRSACVRWNVPTTGARRKRPKAVPRTWGYSASRGNPV